MKLFFIVIFSLISGISLAQNLSTNFLIKDVGYITIPATMEIQSGDYKKYVDEFQDEFGRKYGYEITGDRVVFQQKGLNNLEKEAFSSYARVMFSTIVGNPGDFEKLSTKLKFTKGEISEFSNQMKAQMESIPVPGLKLIRWYGVEIVNVNGVSAIKSSYLRQLHDRPYVLVSFYQFFNNDRLHQLTLSYRLQDADLWKDAYKKILNSFKITNIR